MITGAAYKYFGMGRSSFYRRKAAYEQHGEAGLINAKPDTHYESGGF